MYSRTLPPLGAFCTAQNKWHPITVSLETLWWEKKDIIHFPCRRWIPSGEFDACTRVYRIKSAGDSREECDRGSQRQVHCLLLFVCLYAACGNGTNEWKINEVEKKLTRPKTHQTVAARAAAVTTPAEAPQHQCAWITQQQQQKTARRMNEHKSSRRWSTQFKPTKTEWGKNKYQKVCCDAAQCREGMEFISLILFSCICQPYRSRLSIRMKSIFGFCELARHKLQPSIVLLLSALLSAYFMEPVIIGDGILTFWRKVWACAYHAKTINYTGKLLRHSKMR